ncbi:hypothetical protein [Caenimonas aquaedulcis]|uniref:Uncharacterized protein n=1 Tax=Caenimonas aquaedulcis TaxID=2793270 RepID=A0A931H691_9BURK|nr:hypothetical protein [Caenimonas aquaedulcis]MBG9389414.1 hypothetical protein [Caenimonas aquaedulcis]
MSIDLLPFSSFALESSVGPASGLGDTWTLTLASFEAAHPLLDMAMGGTIVLHVDAAQATGGELARVVPADAAPMTVTF